MPYITCASRTTENQQLKRLILHIYADYDKRLGAYKTRRHRHQKEKGDCANHLKQKFSQNVSNLVWVSDFTYIKAGGKWYFLCVIIDLFSRKVIAWHVSAKLDVNLVMTTFKKAYESRNAPYGLMFHSDRGSQYTAFAFRQLLDSLNVVQPFYRKGYPFDNAVCESFFRYLKKRGNRPEDLCRS